MDTVVGEILARPDLLRNLVWAELTARYKTTTLGILWFVLNPLLMMAILIAVFGRVIQLNIQNYPVFVLSALLPWTFCQMAITTSTNSLTRASGLVKRVRIPREFVPLSALMAGLVHFLISLLLLFAVMALSRVRFTPYMLFLPAAIFLQLIFLTGACLLTSSLNVFYRDIEHVLSPAMQALFYLTPSIYPLSFVPHQWLHWYLLNPMAGIIELYRDTLVLGHLPSLQVVEMATLSSVATLVAGLVIFKRLEPHFDDYI